MNLKFLREYMLASVALTICSRVLAGCPLKDLSAECEIQPNVGKPEGITGMVQFRQSVVWDDCTMGDLRVNVSIENLPVTYGMKRTVHGLHVHTSSDMSQGCDSMGCHFNPYSSPHGAPWNHPNQRHVGDFGNVESNHGHIRTYFTDYLATLHDTNTIIGRGLVLHANSDDLGRGGDEGSLTTGNAGPRLACCVIYST